MNNHFTLIKKGLSFHRFKTHIFYLLLSFLFVIVFIPTIQGQHIYWSEYTRIMRAEPDGSSRVTLISNQDNFQGLVVDTDNEKLYFLNVEDASLERSDLDGSNVEVVFTFPGNQPHSFRHLALDVPNEKVYVCDSHNKDVSRVNYDGTGYEVLIDDCRISHGVVLDLDAGKMYYSCINSPVSFIARSDLDGTNRDTIVSSVKATGMTLDIANSYLYYFDQMNSSQTYDIRRVNYDGTDDQLIYDAPTFAMAIRYDPEDDKLWISRSGDSKIFKMNADGTNVEFILQGWNTTYDLSLALLHTPLPVEFTYFTAKVEEAKQVVLDWETASEENNLGFEIEQSTDGLDWKSIGFVDGMGNSIFEAHYSFTDQNPYPGDNYYRLKQMDNDGKFEYSEVRQVTFNRNEKAILSVFPNPTPDRFVLGVHNPNRERARVELYSSTGQMIWDYTFKKGEMNDYWQKEFSLPQEEIYFIMTQVGEKVETKKVSVISEY